MNERPIPAAALEDEDAVEMLRVWIASRKLHCSLKVGMYYETKRIPEEKAWGTILADVARHIANALREGYECDPNESVAKIRDSFLSDMKDPTSEAPGGFVSRQ